MLFRSKELQVQEIAAAQTLEENSAAPSTPAKEKDSSGSGKSKGGMPKWFKLPGKK